MGSAADSATVFKHRLHDSAVLRHEKCCYAGHGALYLERAVLASSAIVSYAELTNDRVRQHRPFQILHYTLCYAFFFISNFEDAYERLSAETLLRPLLNTFKYFSKNSFAIMRRLRHKACLRARSSVLQLNF